MLKLLPALTAFAAGVNAVSEKNSMATRASEITLVFFMIYTSNFLCVRDFLPRTFANFYDNIGRKSKSTKYEEYDKSVIRDKN